MRIFTELLVQHNDAQPRFQPVAVKQLKIPDRVAALTASDILASTRSYEFNRQSTQTSALRTQANADSAASISSFLSRPQLISSSNTFSSLLNQQKTVNDSRTPISQSSSLMPNNKRASDEYQSKNSPTTPRSPQLKYKQRDRKLPNPAKPQAATKLQTSFKTLGKTISTKDSAPSVSNTPPAVMGNSDNSLAAAIVKDINRKIAKDLRKEATTATKAIKTNYQQQQPRHTSLAKTIAEQTPNAFRTLGPGFNNSAGQERSLTIHGNQKISNISGGSITTIPSDYEHIFHAPSQFVDNNSSSSGSSRKATKVQLKTILSSSGSPRQNKKDKRASDKKRQKR